MVKSPTICLGYYKNKRIQSIINSEGWYDTNDVVQLEKNGISVIGRHDFLYISGGINIYPEEIETLIMKVDSVKFCMVVPETSVKYGHIGIAFIKQEKTCEKKFNDLISIIKSSLTNQLPSYKVPKQFLPWPKKINEEKQSRVYLTNYLKSLK